jgi:hypothetical protein
MSENSKKHSPSLSKVSPSQLTSSSSQSTVHSSQFTVDRPIPYGKQHITDEDIQAVVLKP